MGGSVGRRGHIAQLGSETGKVVRGRDATSRHKVGQLALIRLIANYSRLTVVTRESDHPVSIAGGEIAESDSTAKDIGGRCAEERADFLPESRRRIDAPVLRHVGGDWQIGKVVDDACPAAGGESAASTPFVVV